MQRKWFEFFILSMALCLSLPLACGGKSRNLKKKASPNVSTTASKMTVEKCRATAGTKILSFDEKSCVNSCSEALQLVERNGKCDCKEGYDRNTAGTGCTARSAATPAATTARFDRAACERVENSDCGGTSAACRAGYDKITVGTGFICNLRSERPAAATEAESLLRAQQDRSTTTGSSAIEAKINDNKRKIQEIAALGAGTYKLSAVPELRALPYTPSMWVTAQPDQVKTDLNGGRVVVEVEGSSEKVTLTWTGKSVQVNAGFVTLAENSEKGVKVSAACLDAKCLILGLAIEINKQERKAIVRYIKTDESTSPATQISETL